MRDRQAYQDCSLSAVGGELAGSKAFGRHLLLDGGTFLRDFLPQDGLAGVEGAGSGPRCQRLGRPPRVADFASPARPSPRRTSWPDPPSAGAPARCPKRTAQHHVSRWRRGSQSLLPRCLVTGKATRRRAGRSLPARCPASSRDAGRRECLDRIRVKVDHNHENGCLASSEDPC